MNFILFSLYCLKYLDFINFSFLLQFVDGWEINGKFFPSAEDHLLPEERKVQEFCGKIKSRRVYVSSQNAAVIQYRTPKAGSSFKITVRHVVNPRRKLLPHHSIDQSPHTGLCITRLFCSRNHSRFASEKYFFILPVTCFISY